MPIADDIEIVGSYEHLHEADLARALLEANAIPAWVIDEVQPGRGALQVGGVRVAVPRAHAEEARALLAQDHSTAVEEEAASTPSGAAEEICRRCAAMALLSHGRPRPRLVSLVPAAARPRSRMSYACPVCGYRWSDYGGRTGKSAITLLWAALVVLMGLAAVLATCRAAFVRTD